MYVLYNYFKIYDLKVFLTKWTDTILAKVSIQSPLPVNSKLQITTKSQTLPPLKSNSIWVICLMVSMLAFNNIRVPTKNLKKGPWLLLCGWRILLQKNPPFLRKNKTPMENKCEGYPSTPPPINVFPPPALQLYKYFYTCMFFNFVKKKHSLKLLDQIWTTFALISIHNY